MGFADSVATRGYLVMRKSDLEFQIQGIMERKLAILDACNAVSQAMSNDIFQNGMHSTLSSPSAVPGFIAPSPITDATGNPLITVLQTQYGTNDFELLLGELQATEKVLDVEQKKKETELEAVRAEEESVKKFAIDEHAKKDFKLG